MLLASWTTNRPRLSPFRGKDRISLLDHTVAAAEVFETPPQGREHSAGRLDFNLESAVFVLHSLAHGLENRRAFASRVFGSVYGFWLAFFQLTEPTPQTRGCLRHPSAPRSIRIAGLRLYDS